HIPVIYDIDCGHLPPQLTLINGAYASVNLEKNKDTVVQYFT
ncbi:LD-carboxypeptidase, partial [Priestia megaterium]